jgi:hypothetical protein
VEISEKQRRSIDRSRGEVRARQLREKYENAPLSKRPAIKAELGKVLADLVVASSPSAPSRPARKAKAKPARKTTAAELERKIERLERDMLGGKGARRFSDDATDEQAEINRLCAIKMGVARVERGTVKRADGSVAFDAPIDPAPVMSQDEVNRMVAARMNPGTKRGVVTRNGRIVIGAVVGKGE